MASTLGAVNLFRYRGYVYDADTGLYYLQSRYYDPGCGRFLNADDVQYMGASDTVLGYNLFLYCENDPVNYNDRRGTTRYAIFYDDRQSGYLNGRLFGQGFREQAKYWIRACNSSSQNTVHIYPFNSIEMFIKRWNKASKNPRYDYVFILAHGYIGSMDCNGQRLLCDGEFESNRSIEVYRKSSMKRLKATRVYLFICNAATKTKKGNSLADLFFQKTYALVFGVADGKVNIKYSNGDVEKDGGYWVMISYSVTVGYKPGGMGVDVVYNYYRIVLNRIGYSPNEFSL